MDKEFKTCMDCMLTLDIVNFKPVRDSKSGIFYPRKRCEDCYKAYDKIRNLNNIELKRKWKKENRQEINKRDKENGNSKKWKLIDYHRNKARYITNARTRKKALKQQTPLWEKYSSLQWFYNEATRLELETGNKYHVDHIIPLKHPDVCGLNVVANLQVLPASENQSKSNSFDGTYNNISWKNDK